MAGGPIFPGLVNYVLLLKAPCVYCCTFWCASLLFPKSQVEDIVLLLQLRPALVFHIMGESQLKAAAPKWPERQVLASTAVQCALARPQSSSIPGRVSFEDDQLVLNVRGCLEEAIEALVCSGHAVLGRRCDSHQTSIAASEKAANHNGVWILRDDVLEGIWIQASCGAFVDICSPVSLRKARDCPDAVRGSTLMSKDDAETFLKCRLSSQTPLPLWSSMRQPVCCATVCMEIWP